MKPEVIPAILTADVDELKALLPQSGAVGERVHIDIIDGVFADNTTIDPSVFTSLNTRLKIDYHLMVDKPTGWLPKCANGLGDRVIGQIELMRNQVEFIKKAKSHGMKAGLAIDLKTKLEALEGSIYEIVDVILVMAVNAGFGGQKFENIALDKIESLDLKRKENDYNYKILVDGGVNTNNLFDIVQKNADTVIVGNRIFKGNIKENIDSMLSGLER